MSAGIRVGFALFLMMLLGAEVQAIEIAAFGDSITRGWPYYQDDANGIANNGGYIPGLQSQLNGADWGDGEAVTVYNWGHPGEYVYFEGLYRFPSPILDSQPDYVLILEGTNDLALGWYGPTTIANTLNAIVEEVIEADKIPVIGTIMPRFDSKVDSGDILSINTSIRANAANSNIEVAELYYASTNWNALMTDGLHPNTTGYSLMSTVWYDTLLREKAAREAKEAEEAAAERARIAGAISGTNYLLLLSD